MNAKKRNRFWQLHSLLGITLGLPLFVIFLAGTLALFEPEAINWTQPQFDGSTPAENPLNPVLNELLAKHPGTDELSVVLASDRHPVTDVYLEEDHHPTHYWIDPRDLTVSEATGHEADLFHFFVDLHYFEFLPYGIQISGAIAALFFAIILSGLVYQWRTMRQDLKLKNLSLKGASRWKKVHRFTSLFTLPFQIAYSVTGASLALGLFLAAPAVSVFFDGDQAALNETLFPEHMAMAEPVHEEPTYPVDEALALASAHWGPGVEPLIVHIAREEAHDDHPASHTILVQGKERGLHFVGTSSLTLDEDLNILHDQTPTSHLGPMMIEALVNVHFATFNGFLIKVLFALLGLIVTLSIAAGVYILVQRRRQGAERDSRMTKFLVTTTHWLLGGLPLACALSLHAAQLSPGLPVVLFWIVLVAALPLTLLLKDGLGKVTTASAVAFSLLPLAFLIAQRESPLQVGNTHAVMVSFFNLFFLLMGIAIWQLVRQIKENELTAKAR